MTLLCSSVEVMKLFVVKLDSEVEVDYVGSCWLRMLALVMGSKP